RAEGGAGVRAGRRPNGLRPLEVEVDYLEQPHGAVLWSQGRTKVLCTASIEEGVPRWLRNSGRGWMTAEYSLLPASTGERVEGEPLLDLDYEEDSTAEVDMNVVMDGDGGLIEVQATAEGEPFTRGLLDSLLDLAGEGIAEIGDAQRAALETIVAS